MDYKDYSRREILDKNSSIKKILITKRLIFFLFLRSYSISKHEMEVKPNNNNHLIKNPK